MFCLNDAEKLVKGIVVDKDDFDDDYDDCVFLRLCLGRL